MQQGPVLEFPVRFFHPTLTALVCLGLAALTAGAATTRYVWPDSPNPTPPYTDWTTAAQVIQHAVDAAQVGDLVLVTNGTYAAGGRAVGTNLLANRVAVEKPLRLESVNGASVTIVQGAKAPGGGNGDGAFRCAYLADGVTLSGFTLSGGATRAGDDWRERSGGGAWCASTNAVLTNCVLTSNSAGAGGGASGGTLYNCTLTGNSARDSGGGANDSTLADCTLTGNSASEYGGGAHGGTLNNCTLTGNSAGYGGGASWSTLYNCTLTGNRAVGDEWGNSGMGGGANGGMLYNCTLTGNSAGYGGGASGGTLYNCTLTGNSAESGGGASQGTLYNCTLTGNSAEWWGGGASGGTLYNCIVYFNRAREGANYSGSNFEYSCTTPLPPGPGNTDADPQLSTAWHLLPTSPCIGTGSFAHASGVDIDGELWANPPAMGADQPGPTTGPLSVWIEADFIQVAIGYPISFTAHSTGSILRSEWDFGDGTIQANEPFASRAWVEPGIYPVRLTGYNDSHPEGVTATVEITVTTAVAHVNAAGANPVFPYASWATAATNIQDAIGAATFPGYVVLVTNGVYRIGTVEGALKVSGLNRVALTNRVVVRSVNGPEMTLIEGSRKGPGTGEGVDVRCAYVGDGSVLSGFTLTNGVAGSGGGVLAHSYGVVTSCVLTGNSAGYGGGVYGGTLDNCTLMGNQASAMILAHHHMYQPDGRGGGALYSTLSNCTITGNSANSQGGGVSASTLFNCTLTGNSATGDYGQGGGASGGTLNNCVLTGNSATGTGGGASNGTLNNCTLSGNSAYMGGGASGGTLNNCTLTGNSAEGGGGASSGTLNNCVLSDNSAAWGGGTSEGTLNNCTLTRNSAGEGGGASDGTLNNCTLTSNSAGWGGGGAYGSTLSNCVLTGNSDDRTGGGAFGGTLSNCIVYFNQAPNGPNWSSVAPSFAYSCTTPLPPGPGNVAADPLFVNAAAGDLRLRPDSPCINAGSNEFVFGETDLAGNPRIIGGKVDMGAYEFDPAAPLMLINSVTLTAEGLRIEWPATAVGATLQRSATLNLPAWQDVPGTETITTITVPVGQAQEFFRLVKR